MQANRQEVDMLVLLLTYFYSFFSTFFRIKLYITNFVTMALICLFSTL